MGFFDGPSIVTNGLVLSLDAADKNSYIGSGTVWNDLSGNNNSGSLVNTPTFNSGNGGYLTFNGTTQYASVAGSNTLTSATFIMWLQRSGTQIAYTGTLYSRSTNVTGMGFFSNGTNLGYTWNGNVNTYDWNSGLIIPDGSWVMCAISVSSTSAIAYLGQSSGITTATNSVSHASTTLDALLVGRDSFSTRYFKGNIANAQLYNRTLSSTEITQNYNAQKSRFGL